MPPRRPLLGGFPGPQADVWVQPLTGVPAWSKLNPAGTAPSARYGHTAIYQPGQDRIIMFGGFDTAYRNEVWALSLSGTPTWTQLTPTGTAPPVRAGHVAIYDAARNRMIIFGGRNATNALSDTRALSLGTSPAWSQLALSGGGPPSARAYAAAAYDPAGDLLVLFGGTNPFFPGGFVDTWVLSLAGGVWSQAFPTGTPPSSQRDHSMVCAGGKAFVFGGFGQIGALNATHVLTLTQSSAWSQMSPVGPAPRARSAHGAIYDAPRDRMVIFGGDTGDTGAGSLDETWALPLSGTPTWAMLDDTRRYIDDPRTDFAMANAGGAMVIFGGEPGRTDNTLRLDLTALPSWQPVAPANRPRARR